MKVNVVIVTYNRSELLLKVIKSVRNQTYKINKIIIFDNNSTDDTIQVVIDEISNRDITYIRSSINGGASYGFYYGIAFAITDCEWVWVMDDDVIPNEDALEKLLDKLQSIKSDTSFLCSTVVSPEGFPMNVPSISSETHFNGYGRAYKYLSNMMVEVNTATFVSILINVDAINIVGLPYKEFFIWVDDTEYTRRLTKFYAPAYLVGDSIVTHYRVGSSSLDINKTDDINRIKLFRYLYRNNIVYIKNYGSGYSYFRTIITYFLISIKYTLRLNYLDFVRAKSILIGLSKYIVGDYKRNEFKNRFRNMVSKEEMRSLFEITDFENLHG
jgi:GT2 family glycosyltransferase